MKRGHLRDDVEAFLAVGLGEAELQAYEVLLDRPSSTVGDVAAAIGGTPRRVQRLLADLEFKGLATRLPERNARYLPTPPDIAVEALIARRQEELQRARAAAVRLREKTLAAKEPRPNERVVELVTGRDAQARVFEQIQRGAKQEVLSIERPPYVVGAHTGNAAQDDAMVRGVVYRNILEADALEIPGKAEHVRYMMAAGEQTRVLSGLPLKLVMVDRRIAIIPLDIARASESALLLRPSSLLDALCELFESLWQRATPLGFGAEAGAPKQALASDDVTRLLPLLAAGIKDKVIAHQLGISARTLDRRLVELGRSLGARTRFQAGWLAALRAVGKL